MNEPREANNGVPQGAANGNADFRKLLLDGKRSAQELKNSLSKLEANRNEHWRSAMGPNLDVYLRNPTLAKDLLQHSDSSVRAVAAEILGAFHVDDLAVLEELLHLGVADPVANVRIQAINAVGKFYSGSRDRRIAQFLASRVIDVSESSEVRASAYMMLQLLHSSSYETLTQVLRCRFPEDVNWGFVQAYL